MPALWQGFLIRCSSSSKVYDVPKVAACPSEDRTVELSRLSLNSEVELDRTSCPRIWKVVWAPVRDQVMSDGSNFGEVGICQFKMLSSKGILVFSPPQLSDI